jgi:hypothetical protein
MVDVPSNAARFGEAQPGNTAIYVATHGSPPKQRILFLTTREW